MGFLNEGNKFFYDSKNEEMNVPSMDIKRILSSQLIILCWDSVYYFFSNKEMVSIKVNKIKKT